MHIHNKLQDLWPPKMGSFMHKILFFRWKKWPVDKTLILKFWIPNSTHIFGAKTKFDVCLSVFAITFLIASYKQQKCGLMTPFPTVINLFVRGVKKFSQAVLSLFWKTTFCIISLFHAILWSFLLFLYSNFFGRDL